MCVMAGCDFLPNLPGIAIKKAHALIKKFCDYGKVGEGFGRRGGGE
jgi:exonuclease-1